MTDVAPRITPAEAMKVALRWDPTARDVVHVRTGENSTWRALVGGSSHALRFTDERHRTRSMLEAELDFVSYLATAGLHVARPLPLPGGERVLDATELVSTPGRTYAAAFEWLDGRPYEYHSPDVDRPLFILWGTTMAKLHALSVAYVAPDTARPDWTDDAVAGCAVRDVATSRDTILLRNDLVRLIESWSYDPAHYGLVHGDFERTNFVLDGDRIALFDFDDCCRHWFAWDIACALWVFRHDHAETRARLLDWFLEGYSLVKEPDQRRLQHFSELVQLRTIALLLHRLRRGSADHGAREWVTRNEAWLHSAWRW